MAPPKFKDFSKSNDDAHNKDFICDVFNSKINHNFDCGEHGSGEFTGKLNYNTSNAAVAPEFEIKQKIGSFYPSFLQGATVTKTLSNNGSIKSKIEKPCSKGNKMTFQFNSGLAIDKWFAVSKPSFTFDNAGDKHAFQLNVTPAADLQGMDNTNFNISYNAAGANIGAEVAYNFKNQNVGHHLKLAKSVNGLDFCLGLKQANIIELSASKSINKNLKSPCGCLSFSLDNLHSKSTYDLNKSNWESSVAFDYNNINAFGFALSKGKSKINLKTLEYADRASFKINDNLSVNLGSKTNLDADAFKNWRIGAALNFSL